MNNSKTTYLSLITPFFLICSPLIGADNVPEANAPQEAQNEPRIVGKFYSADTIQALPRLKAIKDQDPECNKIALKPENFPVGKEIDVEVKRLGSINPKEYEHKFSFVVLEDGTIQVSNSDHRLKVILIGSRGYLPGETVSFRFVTADGTIDKESSGIPTPALVRNKEGDVVIKAEMVSLNPTVYKVELLQVQDGEEFDLKATSVGDIIKSRPKYNKSKGFLYTPEAKGISKGGDAVLSIRRKNGDTYAIKLPWGAMLDGYMTGKKIYSSTP